MKKTLLSVLVIVLAAASQLPAITIYSQNFESGGPLAEWTGSGSIQSSGSMPGFQQLHWRNDTTGVTTLTLTGLAAHTQLSLTFDLALWDSIDIGGDQFNITLDSGTLYSSIDFGNYFPVDNISHGPGTHYTAVFSSFAVPDYGYSSGFHDAGQHVSFLNLAHTGSTATFTFQFPNSQGGLDESFGLDNIAISSDAAPPTNGVPEPSSILLSLAGLGALALLRRK